MRKFIATLTKELHLIKRDKKGLALIFALPIMLVFIMTIIQHEAYRSLNETGVPVLLVNMDQDSLGLTIEKSFNEFSLCNVTVDRGEQYGSEQAMTKDVLDGKYLVAVYIPSNATEILRQDVDRIVQSITQGQSIKERDLKQIEIDIIVDPIARKSFVMAISSGLREFIATVKTQVLFSMMASSMQTLTGLERDLNFPKKDFFQFNETYATDVNSTEVYAPNAVQHNIPAWAIFSIFFIIIPLAAGIIQERTEGLYMRMRTLPVSYFSLLSGKLFLYLIIAFLQMMMIVAIGKFLLPLIGLPVLVMGSSIFAFIILTLVVSMAAVSYGLFLGTAFNSAPQASIFGGISVLIFSALGGIWVPLNIMPDLMQSISVISPLNWALKGFYTLFIKGGGLADISAYMIGLLIFIMVMLVLTFYIFSTKRKPL